MTAIFLDLKGYTATAETMEPERLMGWLNEYLEAMTALVYEGGGLVIKFMGDSIMAVFGAPLPRTTEDEIRQDAVAAVRCALGMGRQIELLNTKWSREGLPKTAMRVGVFTGEAVAGSVGSAARLEYTVTGDTVNIASRLENLDKEAGGADDNPCRILIGDTTCAMLGDFFETRPFGSIALRGKKAPVRVSLVKCERIPQETTA